MDDAKDDEKEEEEEEEEKGVRDGRGISNFGRGKPLDFTRCKTDTHGTHTSDTQATIMTFSHDVSLSLSFFLSLYLSLECDEVEV